MRGIRIPSRTSKNKFNTIKRKPFNVAEMFALSTFIIQFLSNKEIRQILCSYITLPLSMLLLHRSVFLLIHFTIWKIFEDIHFVATNRIISPVLSLTIQSYLKNLMHLQRNLYFTNGIIVHMISYICFSSFSDGFKH